MTNPSPRGGSADVFSTGFATPERASPIRGKPGFFRAAKARLTVRAAEARLTLRAAKPNLPLEAVKAILTVSRSSRY